MRKYRTEFNTGRKEPIIRLNSNDKYTWRLDPSDINPAIEGFIEVEGSLPGIRPTLTVSIHGPVTGEIYRAQLHVSDLVPFAASILRRMNSSLLNTNPDSQPF